MPIYEYLCGACKHQLDALQKVADEPLVHCPHCGAPELKRQLSAPRFRLKGTGWYETDFKTDKRRNIADSARKDGEKPAAAGDGKADGKSAAGEAGKSVKPADDAGKKPDAGKVGGAA